MAEVIHSTKKFDKKFEFWRSIQSPGAASWLIIFGVGVYDLATWNRWIFPRSDRFRGWSYISEAVVVK